MKFVMEWDDWIKLTDAEQEAVRQREAEKYAMQPHACADIAPEDCLPVEGQRRLLEELIGRSSHTRPDRMERQR